jgi:AraC-like DNA-binding protein
MQGAAQESLRREMPFLSVDLDMLGKKFCPENKEFLLRTNEQLNVVFSQLYHTSESMRLSFFRVKIAELLLLLSALDTAANSEQRQYFPASQTAKIKEIHSLITSRPDKTFTVEELSEISGMPPASLRKVFKAVYGTPVYQYIKSCKMKTAAEMLISARGMNIADIAQQLGYDNASKFSAAFRDVMGISPQNYRNRQEDI